MTEILKQKKVYPQIVCPQCGITFEQKRVWQVFCGLNCRMQHHKFARKDLDKRITKLEEQINILMTGKPNG